MARFGPFTLDPERGELRKDGRLVRLQPQPAKLLSLLVIRPDEVVTREEIQKALWPDGTVVDYDQSINFCIKRIREVLGDDAEQPRFVETVPRRGYRFVAPVETEVNSTSESGHRPRWFAIIALVLSVGLLAAALARRPTKSDEMLPATRPFTSFEGEEDMPSFSPNGDQIAYVWNGDGFFHVYVRLVVGGEPLQLTNALADDLFPSWSPDGSTIAFLRDLWDGNQGGYEIRTVSALGGQERVWGRVSRLETRPVWHPDGERVVIRDESGAGRGLALLTLRTGERRTLSVPPNERFYDREAVYSPDGRQVAILRSVGAGGGVGEILIQPVRGGETRPLTFGNRPIRGYDWTSDGTAIVFSSSRLETFSTQLWKVAVSGGEPEPIPFGEDAGALSVAKKGHRLAYATLAHDRNVWRVSGPAASELRPPEKLIASTRDEFLPEYSPDGSQIAFVSDREGDLEIWTSDASGGAASPVAGPVVWGFPRWSRNGESIAYTATTDKGSSGIFTVDVRGGTIRPLTPSEHPSAAPDWSFDDEWVFFSSLRAGQWTIWKVPSAGGEVVPITEGFGLRPTTMGDRVYYLREFKVWSAPADGEGEETVVLHKLVEFFSWTLWQGSIVYINRDAEPGPSVEIYDPASGDTRHVASLGENSDPGPGLSVSPNGEWILYTEDEGRSRRDIMLVENFDP